MHQGVGRRVDRALGADEIVDIGLGNDQIALVARILGGNQEELQAAVLGGSDTAGRAVGLQPAAAVDDPAEEQAGQGVDQPRAADAHRRAAVDGAGRDGGSLAENPHLVDRAAGGPHPARHRASLEGWPRRGRTGHQKLTVPQHHFAVGADVEKQGQLVGTVHSAGQDAGGDVAAHVAADRRQGVEDASGMDANAQFGRSDRRRASHRGHKRAKTQEIRLQPQQEMRHRRVPRGRRAEDVAPANLGAAHQVVDQFVDVLNHGPVHGLGAAGTAGMVDPVDHVLAEADLRVVLGGRPARGSRVEVHQVNDKGSGAHVHRQPETAVRGVAPLHA